MSNRLTWNNYEFDDGSIQMGSIKLHIEKTMLGDELSADTLSFIVYKSDQTAGALKSLTSYLQSNQGHALFCYSSSQSVDFSTWQYGQAVNIYHDDALMAKMYLKNIERIAKNAYQFNCISAMGLLINREHKGGIYSGLANDTIGSICAELLSGISYTIDADIAAEKVNGRLKIASCRDSLRDLMFAYGGSVLKAANGNLLITYNSPQTVTNIPQSDIYIGGDIKYLTPATTVVLTEHSYSESPSVATQTLYETVAQVTDATIIFDEAIQLDTLSYQGFSISESNPNYIVVSGAGTITGKPYLHTQRQLTKATGISADANEVSITDAYLVNTLNSANCLERIKKYYSLVNEVNCDIKLTNVNILPGSKVSFTDPFGDAKEGFIASMDIIFSTIMKASSTIAVGWIPGPFGNSLSNVRTFTESDISGGTLTIPAEMRGKQATVVLMGGGQGGHGGYSGNDGSDGKAGAGGEGGHAGKITQFTMTLPNSISASIGAGGAGGASDTEGAEGGDTTFGTYSSANGIYYDAPYTDMILGNQYAFSGDSGVAGADGAINGGHFIQQDFEGDSVTYNGITYPGGHFRGATSEWTYGLGGGAAVGSAGGDGGEGHYYPISNVSYGGNGGGGATATIAGANATVRASGANGGHGGGGGGAGGYGYKGTTNRGANGSGGHGSRGGDGQPGIILIYF